MSLILHIAVFLQNIPTVKSPLFLPQGSPLHIPLAHLSRAWGNGQRQCHSTAQAGTQAMGTKQGRRGGTNLLGCRTCFSCLLPLQSARMLHAAPSHLLPETSKRFIPANPFLDFSTGLGWQIGPSKSEEEPDRSPPQEMLTTSPVDIATISRKEAVLLCEVTVLEGTHQAGSQADLGAQDTALW